MVFSDETERPLFKCEFPLFGKEGPEEIFGRDNEEM
jgi:hypothetical protein